MRAVFGGCRFHHGFGLVLLMFPLNAQELARVTESRIHIVEARGGETLATLFDYLRAGKINPVIAARVPLLEAVRAHHLLEAGGHRGKVILVVD